MFEKEAKNKNIVIVISSMLFYRNYISSGVVNKIQSNFDNVKILADVSLKNNEFPSETIFYDYKNRQHQAHMRFLKVLTWRYRNKSKTFWFRLRRSARFRGFGEFNEDLTFFSRLRLFWTHNINSLLRWAKLIFLGNRFIFPLTRAYFINRLKPMQTIVDKVLALDPKIILFPSSAYDPVAIDLTLIGKSHNITTFNLIDNWDNLSSKSILWVLSDFVGVWGQQSKEHAIDIQCYNPESVKILGTPRFDNYFSEREKKLKSNFDFPYILYVGTSLFTDEVGVLSHLNNLLENRSDYGNNVRIVYRPHPWGMQKNIDILKNFNKVNIDPQVQESFKRPLGDLNFQPDLNYYPSLISNALFVVGGLTSMAIEASIFLKYFVAICHEEEGIFTDPYAIKNNYVHFEGLERLENIKFSNDFNHLDRIVDSLFEKKFALKNASLIDNNRQYFLFKGQTSYVENLMDHINDIIK